MKKQDWKELVGKRVLVRAGRLAVLSSIGTATEHTVVEVSPSGLRVKLRNVNGDTFWWNASELELVEVLRARGSGGAGRRAMAERCDFCVSDLDQGNCRSCEVYNGAVEAQRAAAHRIAKQRYPRSRDAWLNEHGVFAWVDGKVEQVGTAEEAAPFAALTTEVRKASVFWCAPKPGRPTGSVVTNGEDDIPNADGTHPLDPPLPDKPKEEGDG